MPIVDLAFRITGKSVPADHGYVLHGALCKALPGVRGRKPPPGGAEEDTPFGVHPISGRAIGERQLALHENSRLTLRVESEQISRFLPLAGKSITLGGSPLQVGVPEVRPLVPAARLYSRLVIIKGFMQPEPFLEAVRRHLDELGVKGEAGLLRRQGARALEGHSGAEPDRCPFIRRTLRIREKEIVGFAVEVRNLTAEESILLQEKGLGGRRHFGCGVFVPQGGGEE
jgi:CRISPR-associated protein Cas6